MRIWKAIETAPEAAAKKDWQRWLGGMFDRVAEASWLRDTKLRAKFVSCDSGCGCNHRVEETTGGYEGICDCGTSCSNIPLSVDDLKEMEFRLESLGSSVAKALGCKSNPGEIGLYRTKEVASFGHQSVPIILTIQPDQERFDKIVEQLVERLKWKFILLAPTKRFGDNNSLGIQTQGKAVFFDLDAILHFRFSELKAYKSGEELFSPYFPLIVEPSGDHKLRQSEPMVSDSGGNVFPNESLLAVSSHVLENIQREVLAGQAENREGFKKVGRGMVAVATGKFELLKENEELRRFREEGFFKFSLRIDTQDYVAFAVIMALGNRKAAAEHLKIPLRSFYARVEKWSNRGRDYQLMLRYTEWRKRTARYIEVPLSEALTTGESGGAAENPETFGDLMNAIETKERSRPEILAEILTALRQQNPTNWAMVRNELIDLIQEEDPQ